MSRPMFDDSAQKFALVCLLSPKRFFTAEKNVDKSLTAM